MRGKCGTICYQRVRFGCQPRVRTRSLAAKGIKIDPVQRSGDKNDEMIRIVINGTNRKLGGKRLHGVASHSRRRR